MEICGDMQNKRVVITGLGVLSPFGNLEDTVRCINHNLKCYNTKHSIKVDSNTFVEYPIGLVNTYNTNNRKFDRVANTADKFAYIATKDALNGYCPSPSFTGVAINSSLLGFINIQNILNCLGNNPQDIPTGDFFKTFKNSPAFNIAQEFNFRGECISSAATCATSLQNIILGYRSILQNDMDMMICGGTEEYHPSISYIFHRLGIASKTECKPFADDRDGTVISEGAGIVVLEELDHALHRRATIYGEIVGTNMNCSDSITVSTKDSINECMYWCIARRNPPIRDITVNAHATGTVLGDKNELEAIKELLPTSEIRTYKQYLGHTMAASAASELAIDLYKQDFKYLLKNSFGLGGINCSILIKKYN